jgi:hypothetical protein
MNTLTQSGYSLAEETPAEASGAILSGLEYLAREALAAGLPSLSDALVGIIMDPTAWKDAG